MRIAVFCATRRGYRFLEKLAQLMPEAELLVFSFREEPWEPPFVDDIRQLATAVGAQFYESRQAGAARWQTLWAANSIDLMFSVNWRYIIPAAVYERARLGAYVFHDSLLPEYRGFSPTVWAIINGEDHTGVTLFEMVEDFDAGQIIGQQRVPILPDDTIKKVIEQVTEAYLCLLEQHLPALLAGTATRTPQDESSVTYTCKLLPEDFAIDWCATTESIYNLIRAVTSPYPGAHTILKGQTLRIWQARRLAQPKVYVGRIPGRVVEIRPGEGVIVLTGDGALLLTQVQPEDGEALPADQVLNRISYTLGR